MNRLFRAIMFLVIIGGVLVGGASELLRNEITRVADADAEDSVEFTVEPGQTVSEIAASLDRAGLIRQPLLFRLLVSRQNAGDRLQAGTYTLAPSMTMSEIIATLRTAPSFEETQFTIIPGMRLEEVAEVMVDAGIVDDPQEFIEAASDAAPFKETHALLESIPEGEGLEGYLFPDTYRVRANATVEEVIDRILTDGFTANFSTFETEIIAEGPDGGPPTVHQLVTMASIVQREAANNQEMAHLAYIFWNRLKPEYADEVAGRLQADPTLQYALGEPGNWWPKLDELTLDEINNNESPYNTRRIQGLPPGPIANPALQALRAAARPGPLRPDGTDGENDLYFVARCGEPGHAYAATLAEFEVLQNEFLNCPAE